MTDEKAKNENYYLHPDQSAYIKALAAKSFDNNASAALRAIIAEYQQTHTQEQTA